MRNKSGYFRKLFLAAVLSLGLVLRLGVGPLSSAAPSAPAATPIYVRTGGDDTLCDGTGNVDYSAAIAPACAVQTIQQGIDLVDPGGTVIVAPGLYEERIVITKSLTLRGATYTANKNGYPVPSDYAWDPTVESVIQNPDPALATSQVVDIVDVSDVTVEGFVIQSLNALCPSTNDHLVRVYAQNTGMNNVTIRNNVIGPNRNQYARSGSCGRMGLYLALPNYDDSRDITNSTISGNKIFDTKGNGNTVFVWGGAESYNAAARGDLTGTVIEDNEIYGSHRSGIEISGSADNLTIRNNTIYDNSGFPTDAPSDLKYGNGLTIIRMGSDRTSATGEGARGLVIQNNEIYGNQKNGIYVGPANSDHVISGNTIRSNGWDGIRVDLDELYYGGTATPVYTRTSNVNADLNVIRTNIGYGARVIGTPANGFELQARQVWWGAADGPAGAGPGSGDEVSAYVRHCPWLDAAPPAGAPASPNGNIVTNTDTGEPFCTIQEAIDDDDTLTGHSLIASAGTYTENVRITKGITLAGSGQGSTILLPAFSKPGCATADSLCGSSIDSSNLILVEADDVTVHDVTLDGDNPALTSGVVRNGADVDARNGLITNHYSGTLNGLEVYNTTVRNIYLQGIYPSSAGTFDVHDNVVQNVHGETQSIAIMNWSGSGIFARNVVSDSNDAIAANHSKGTQFIDNVVSNSGSGVHTDNAGDDGGTADLLQGNVVRNCPANGYGVWVFAPRIAATVRDNRVEGCAVGLAMAGGVDNPVTSIFENNVVTGTTGSTGVYVTTSHFGEGSGDTAATFTNNRISNTDYGFYVEQETATEGILLNATSNVVRDSLEAGVFLSGTSAITATFGGSLAEANSFINNGVNITTTLQNTNPDVLATYNDWGVTDLNAIESLIHHQADNPALAEVVYYDLVASSSPTIVPANGTDFATITGTLTGLVDPAGNVVSFTTDLGTLSGATATTGAGGDATVTLSSVTGGVATLTATAGMAALPAAENVLSDTTQVTFARVQNLDTGEYFLTIQAAIDDPDTLDGHTIFALGGNYNELVTIDKAIHLRGADRATTIIDGSGLAGSPLVTIPSLAGDVTLSGFTLQNAPLYGATPHRVCIVANGGAPGSSLTITGTTLIGAGDLAVHDYGLIMQGTESNLTFQHNVVQDFSYSGILLERFLGQSDVGWNDVTVYPDPYANFLVNMSYENPTGSGNMNHVTALQWVHDNVIDANGGSGIVFISAFGWSYNARTGGIFSNVEIAGNTITNVGGKAIQLETDGDGGGFVGARIVENTLSTTIVTNTRGIRLLATMTDTQILTNSITGFGQGIYQSYSWGQPGAVAPRGTEVHANTISGNVTGVENQYTGVDIDATFNWWGAADGPGGVGPGSGDPVSAHVLYCPWLDGPYPGGSPATGDRSVTNQQTGELFCTIQSAVDDTDTLNGHTLLASAGVFTENVVLDKELTVVGAGSGDTAADTSVGMASGAGFDLQASNVTLRDLRIRGTSDITSGTDGIYVNQKLSNVTLDNLVVTGNYEGMMVDQQGGIDGLTITNSHFDANEHIGLYSMADSARSDNHLDLTNVLITGTTFNENAYKGIYLEKVNAATFRDVDVVHSGYLCPQLYFDWPSGIDLNLKFGSYQDLTFRRVHVVNSGNADVSPLPCDQSPYNSLTNEQRFVGMTVKARDDGATYGANPATLTGVTIEESEFTGNSTGLRFGEPEKNNAGPTGVTVSLSRIAGNAVSGLKNETQAAVVAENDWWGCNYGPGNGGAGCLGTADPITTTSTGSVDAAPWLTLGFDVTPLAISIGSTATLTSDLTWNSVPSDTSALGHLPDGTPVAFGATLGSVSPVLTGTTAGIATATYTAPFVQSVPEVTTTVDSQTLSQTVTVGGHGTPVAVELIPDPHTLVAGESVTYTVVATDTYGNSWDATAEAAYAIEAGAGGSWTANTYTSQLVGTWTVTATVDGTDGTATLTVTHAPVAAIALTPDPHTMSAGETITYTVVATDTVGNSWDVTASTAFTIEPGAGGTWTANAYAGEVAGTWTVTATTGTFTDTATLTVTHAPAAAIALTPEAHTVTAGDAVTYTVAVTDSYGNSWDATAEAAYAIEAGAGGTWTANTYTSQFAGTWSVTATVGPISDTAALTVTLGPIAAVGLTPDPHTMAAGETVTYTVVASDTAGNSWDATAGATFAIDAGAGGTWAANAYTGEFAGTWTVTATVSSLTETATLTVTHAPVTAIALTPEAHTVTAGESVTYTVTAVDSYGNGWDTTAEATFAIEAGAGGTWMSGTYTSEVSGTWAVTATVDTLTDTATLTVTHGPVTSITLLPSWHTLTAGESITYTVTARDAAGNRWDATAEATYSMQTAAGGSWTDNVYTSEFSGRWFATARVGTASDLAILSVLHADATTIELSPDPHTMATGETVVYTVVATDTYGNDWNATSTAAFTIEVEAGGSWTNNAYTGEVTGTWTVTATMGNITDTATLTVTERQIAALELAPDPHTMAAGETVTYTVVATDTAGNSWDATAEATFAIEAGAGGSWTANAYTGEFAGTWTVTATVDATVTTATLTVTETQIAALELSPDPHTMATGETVTYTVVATDTAGNSWDATAEASFAIEPGAGGTWTANAYTGEVAGTWAVTATVNNVTGTATLTVVPAPATTIDLQPATSIVNAGSAITYSVTATDTFGNGWDATAEATFAIETGAGGSWVGSTYVSEFGGIWTVTATVGTLSDTAVLIVDPALTVDHFIISPISNQIAGADFTVTITATSHTGQTVEGYAGDAELRDASGTLAPTTVGPFTAGRWTGPVSVTQAIAGDVLTATHPISTFVTGWSNAFTVTHNAATGVTLAPNPHTLAPGESVAYTVAAVDAYGNGWDATAGTTFAIEAGAGGSWSDNVYTSEFTGTWTVTGTVGGASGTATLVVESAAPASYAVYLPLVARTEPALPLAPDLVVERIIATNNEVQVVIRNVGTAAVPDDPDYEFWVDLYVAPDRVPTYNESWNMVGSHGAAWGITSSGSSYTPPDPARQALPLEPGEVFTLTTGGDYYWPEISDVGWPLVTGTLLYAQVDTYNADTYYGAVEEIHEILGQDYNNVFGPIEVVAGTSVQIKPVVPQQRRTGTHNLPPRQF